MVVTGLVVLYGMMMMPVMNVFVPISTLVIHMKIILNFLKGRSRYASLFKLKITDYKGWAHGLKKAGYATDPRYAYRLIDIIELYELHKYDTKDGIKWMKEFPNPHQPYLANDLLYIVVRPGDTFKKLSKEFDISQRKLRKYNDLYKGYVLKPGDIIYLDKKHRRADKEHIVHVVRGGESMYSIPKNMVFV